MSTGTPLLATLIRRVHLGIRQQLHADLLAAGFDDLSPAHLYIFQSPGPDGARPTELAARTNMTKQAMNHHLAFLERHGYLERDRASDDRRGTVVRLTPRGGDVVRVLREGSLRFERSWGRALGTERISELRRMLRDVDALD